jgi:hypothetical protein
MDDAKVRNKVDQSGRKEWSQDFDEEAEHETLSTKGFMG